VDSFSPPRPGALNFLLGTGLYSGLLPKAPGTAGSLAALFVIYPVGLWFGSTGLGIFLVFWIAASLLTLPSFEPAYGKDPSLFVADEWAGQVIPFIGIAFTGNLMTDLSLLLTGFLLFRLFDIFKPLGIDPLQKLPSGYGVLTDDLLAGVYALMCLKLLLFIMA
jgi:phosphatidylglycerophosphatase A